MALKRLPQGFFHRISSTGFLPQGCFLPTAARALQGVLKMGQEVEVRPGIVTKDAEGRAACLPIYSRIVSLKAEENALQYAVPGGLIGVGMTVRRHPPTWPASSLRAMSRCATQRPAASSLLTWRCQGSST